MPIRESQYRAAGAKIFVQFRRDLVIAAVRLKEQQAISLQHLGQCIYVGNACFEADDICNAKASEHRAVELVMARGTKSYFERTGGYLSVTFQFSNDVKKGARIAFLGVKNT